MFYEVKEILVEAESVEMMPPFIIQCFDSNGMFEKDDFMCKAQIDITPEFLERNHVLTGSGNKDILELEKPPQPFWYEMREKSKGPVRGHVLLSFNISEEKYQYHAPLEKAENIRLEDYVEYNDYKCDFNILGLRNLQSAGILPVKKAFMDFKIRGLLPMDSEQAVEDIITEAKSAGPNPTINTVI
jgi:hypothetical protein